MRLKDDCDFVCNIAENVSKLQKQFDEYFIYGNVHRVLKIEEENMWNDKSMFYF